MHARTLSKGFTFACFCLLCSDAFPTREADETEESDLAKAHWLAAAMRLFLMLFQGTSVLVLVTFPRYRKPKRDVPHHIEANKVLLLQKEVMPGSRGLAYPRHHKGCAER